MIHSVVSGFQGVGAGYLFTSAHSDAKIKMGITAPQIVDFYVKYLGVEKPKDLQIYTEITNNITTAETAISYTAAIFSTTTQLECLKNLSRKITAALYPVDILCNRLFYVYLPMNLLITCIKREDYSKFKKFTSELSSKIDRRVEKYVKPTPIDSLKIHCLKTLNWPLQFLPDTLSDRTVSVLITSSQCIHRFIHTCMVIEALALIYLGQPIFGGALLFTLTYRSILALTPISSEPLTQTYIPVIGSIGLCIGQNHLLIKLIAVAMLLSCFPAPTETPEDILTVD